MKLEDYIVSLLRDHNCVIVPEFGGFIANYKSAVIDEARKKIIPPSKNVLFNPKLVNNDGLLGAKVANEESIPYDVALKQISSRAQEWRSILKEGGRVEIGEIGFLCHQNETIIFEQNRDVNLLMQAYGLAGISFVTFGAEKSTVKIQRSEEKKLMKPVIREEFSKEEQFKPVEAESKEKVEKTTPVISINTTERIEVVQAVGEDNDTKQDEIRKPGVRKWKYLAAAAAIPFLFYSYWIPMETDFFDTGQIQWSDFNPIHKQQNKLYQSRDTDADIVKNSGEWKSWEELTENISTDVEIYNYKFSDQLYIPVRLSTDVAQDDPELNKTENPDTNGAYYIIGGCFSVKNNAENLVEELMEKGYPAQILDKNEGLHRVSAGGFASKEDAKSALDQFRNHGYSGWILKK